MNTRNRLQIKKRFPLSSAVFPDLPVAIARAGNLPAKKGFTPLENPACKHRVKYTERKRGIMPRLNFLTGFSLIELLVVIAVVGSLLALSLPRFRSTFNNLKFDNFCQNLISRMRYLQERASVEQKNYRLSFDLNNKIIKIEVKEDTSQEFTDAQGLLGKEIIVPDGIDIEIEETEIYFYPDGSIEGKNIEVLGYQNKATIYIKESIGRIDLLR